MAIFDALMVFVLNSLAFDSFPSKHTVEACTMHKSPELIVTMKIISFCNIFTSKLCTLLTQMLK